MKATFRIIQCIIFSGTISFIHCQGITNPKTDSIKEDPLKYSKEEFFAFTMNNISMWKEIVAKSETKLATSPTDTILLYLSIRYGYGLLTACLGNQDKETFYEYVNKTQERINILLSMTPYWSAVHAFQAGLYSLRMGFNPGKGMSLGPKSEKAIDKAIKYNPEEPTGWQQKAGSKLHTPKSFGGSTPEAIKCYMKAIELYESNEKFTVNNWQYLNAITWLGIAYEKTEQYEKAFKTYEKALEFAPDYGWVKYALYPQVKEKIQNKE